MKARLDSQSQLCLFHNIDWAMFRKLVYYISKLKLTMKFVLLLSKIRMNLFFRQQ